MIPELERLDGAIAQLKATHKADEPGFCLALVHEGQVLRQVHHGMAHLEWQQPIAGDTRFYLASESKPWVAALVMRAVAAGRLRLGDDVRPWLPALKSYEQAIQLGHLLRHSSGIADYLFLWHAQLGRHEHDIVTQAQALELIALADDVQFKPGTRHEYSNSNYVLLAELLKAVEGAELAELLHRHCFEPWGMADSSVESQPGRVMARRARSYVRDEGDKALPDAWLDAPVALASWGDGGIWSTLDDLIRAEPFWQAQAGSEPSLLTQCCAQDEHFAPADTAYRLGLEVVAHGEEQLVFHGGGYAAFSSLMLRNPRRGLSLIVLSNAEGFETDLSTWATRLWAPAAELT
ncbi:CubicO group peptidase (beta-lactamase class C family) [Paucibacter oligotrophus]|uniref:CubicO group peptidase (Beta-lactamase class C family) n=1 Tax=Roseateles oligotrophus TaxID=1769250 RepID=A0A840L4J8_9BURK|nr:serine hydrolase domain-containing protein [Roseateles oligotrophus]MBB4843130.1 CubicO group peptidase (beta-lactamase class C family) [Roseateles oligotrophus]